MNSLENEILKVFLMKENTIMSINDDACVSYLARGHNRLSLAIPFNLDIDINQDFVGMKITKSFINFDNNSISSLCLTAYDNVDSHKFALIAADFASSRNRRTLLTNPYEWIDKWRVLFGDSLKKKMVYDVLGELISLKTVYQNDKSVIWMGPSAGTHDIVGDNNICEVKTTLKKTEYIVSINSSYQLSTTKPTKLFFIRLEKKPYCLTINQLVATLTSMGYPEQDLEDSLESLGYAKGDRSRDESYDLLSILEYEINKESFPLFTIDDINTFAPQSNIVSYSIGLDLSNIDHRTIFEKN